MFIEAALLGLLAGWARGGSLKRLAEVSLPGWFLLPAALFIQFALWIDFTRGWQYLTPAAPYLHVLSYLPLLLFIFLARNQKSMALIGLGLLLNLVVIAANGGMMPVDPAALGSPLREELLSGEGSPLHVPLTGDTRLPFLADLFRIPYGGHKVISIGDIALAAGLFLFIMQGMLTSAGPRREGHN